MFYRTHGLTAEADVLSEHIDGLYSYALTLSCNGVDAEDLVQETYIRAMPALRWLRKGSNVKSWMLSTLRNIWLKELRQRPVHVSGTKSDLTLPACRAASTHDPQSLLQVSTDQDQVREAISQLSLECREIILLREFEDLSYEEIAGVLRCPIGTVILRLEKARCKLRALLSTALAGTN